MIGRYDRGVTRRVTLKSELIAARDEVIAEKIYARGIHPPDKICARCKSECGPRILPGHDTLCDACAAMPMVGVTHAIDCDMDEDCTCKPDEPEPCDHMTDDCTCGPDEP